MNKILYGSVALAAMLAGPAMAADMGVPRTFAPAPATWTGFYVGGNFGGVWGNTDPGTIAGCPPTVGASTVVGGVLPNLPAGNCYWAFGTGAGGNATNVSNVGTQTIHNSGWTGGGQIGFNYQYQWAVFGIEADLESFRPKGSHAVSGSYGILPNTPLCGLGVGVVAVGGGCAFGFSQSSDGKWMTTVRGKVGAVWNNWMIYGTMGVAWAKMSFTSNFADATGPIVALPGTTGLINGGAVSSFTVTQTKVGVVGGAGLSYMLGRNWIVSVEYLRAEIWGVGGDTTLATTTATPLAPAFGTTNLFPGTLHYDATYIENIVRAKVDFKF
jgi:outer membrane immunogenic protein